MLNDLKKFFIYNKSERRGIFVLLVLILLLLLTNLSLPYLLNNDVENDPELIALIDSFLLQESRKDSLLYAINQSDSVDYFYFDPNQLPVEKWQVLGLSEKQIRVIKNYEKSGGKFYRKEDLKKIYSISDKKYSRLEPYIVIGKKKHYDEKRQATSTRTSKNKTEKAKAGEPSKNHVNAQKQHLRIELNEADTANLMRLYGIGPVFAARIIKYRQLIGGYYSTDQLLEVYGFDSVRLAGIKENIYTDTTKIKKVMVNSFTFKKILRHPYFSYELTREIFRHREMGLIKNIHEIRNFKSVSDSLFQKIIPYLSFE